MNDIESIIPNELPFGDDEKIFQYYDEEDCPVGDACSLKDFYKSISDISGISEELMGNYGD